MIKKSGLANDTTGIETNVEIPKEKFKGVKVPYRW